MRTEDSVSKYYRDILIEYKIESAKRNKEAEFQSNLVDEQVEDIVNKIVGSKTFVEFSEINDRWKVKEQLSFPRRIYRKLKKYWIVRASWELVKKIMGKEMV